jgi:hypothetical protein
MTIFMCQMEAGAGRRFCLSSPARVSGNARLTFRSEETCRCRYALLCTAQLNPSLKYSNQVQAPLSLFISPEKG